MGKKTREIRSSIKSLARALGYREDETGELKQVVTKAEARRRFLERKWAFSFFDLRFDWRSFHEDYKVALQSEIVSSMVAKIVEDVDALLLGSV